MNNLSVKITAHYGSVAAMHQSDAYISMKSRRDYLCELIKLSMEDHKEATKTYCKTIPFFKKLSVPLFNAINAEEMRKEWKELARRCEDQLSCPYMVTVNSIERVMDLSMRRHRHMVNIINLKRGLEFDQYSYKGE